MQRNYQPLVFSDNPLLLAMNESHWSYDERMRTRACSTAEQRMRRLLRQLQSASLASEPAAMIGAAAPQAKR